MSNFTDMVYSGNVYTTIKIGNKIIELNNHNSGTVFLKKLFTKLITGNFEGAQDTPSFLDLRWYDNATETWLPALSSQIPLTSKTYAWNSDKNNWVAEFNAVIDHSNLIEDIESNSSKEYRLFLQSGYDPLGGIDPLNIEYYHDIASLDVLANDLSKIVPGTQAIISWQMQLLNEGENK